MYLTSFLSIIIIIISIISLSFPQQTTLFPLPLRVLLIFDGIVLGVKCFHVIAQHTVTSDPFNTMEYEISTQQTKVKSIFECKFNNCVRVYELKVIIVWIILLCAFYLCPQIQSASNVAV